MSAPTVCAVMLTRDRPEMARRAVECFRAQTYASKYLLIYDNGEPFTPECGEGIFHWLALSSDIPVSIGALRNAANRHSRGATVSGHAPDIIVHWDDDDWSHPNRIAEQIEVLQSSDADCVGYREMLFWREPQLEAWLYADAYRPVGTSLCYWRKTWERHPFPDLPQPRRQPNPDLRGEDVEWLRGMNAVAVSCFPSKPECMIPKQIGNTLVLEDPLKAYVDDPSLDLNPRMIARIHSGNSSGSYAELGKSVWWRRVPEWDAYCRERMTL